jgi:signal transduction histidine kinase
MIIDSKDLDGRIAEIVSSRNQIAYLVTSPELTVLLASDNFSSLFPRQTKKVMGAHLLTAIWELVGSEDQIHAVLLGDLPALTIDKINWPLSDGKVHYYDLGIYPISPRDPANGLLLLIAENTEASELQRPLIQDRNELRLTQRKLASANQAFERLDKLKSLFLSMAAHDLRNPLTTILGAAQLIEMFLGKDASEDVSNLLSIIIDESQQMNYLIGDLLDLDHIERGKPLVRTEDVDLAEIIRLCNRNLINQAERMNLSLELTIHDEPLIIRADPKKVRQIFYNILSNAMKYSKQDGKIAISVFRSGEWGIFDVEDSGVGMSIADLAGLFQLYFRATDVQESSVSGTGLGLYIVKSLLDAMSGKIDVESEKGQGSKFSVYLPAAPR